MRELSWFVYLRLNKQFVNLKFTYFRWKSRAISKSIFNVNQCPRFFSLKKFQSKSRKYSLQFHVSIQRVAQKQVPVQNQRYQAILSNQYPVGLSSNLSGLVSHVFHYRFWCIWTFSVILLLLFSVKFFFWI